MKSFRTLDDVDVKGKRVLLRVDLNVPMENGRVTDATRLERVAPTITEISDKGVKILVDPKAVLFLLGTEMDYKADKMQSQFIFNNPNQTGACGCGESVQLTAAKVEG